MNILIIGGGNMGLTYAQAFLRSHITTREQLMILEHLPEKAVQLQELNIAQVFLDSKDCIKKADVIILAVKPQDSISLFSHLVCCHVVPRFLFRCASDTEALVT